MENKVALVVLRFTLVALVAFQTQPLLYQKFRLSKLASSFDHSVCRPGGGQGGQGSLSLFSEREANLSKGAEQSRGKVERQKCKR